MIPRRTKVVLYVCVALLGALAACDKPGRLDTFTLETTTGPTGSLLVRGCVDAPDGALVLLHAKGGADLGAALETGALTPLVDGCYFVDLATYQPLAYEIEAVLGPRFNAPSTLPPKPYPVADDRLTVREDAEGAWEIVRAETMRLGTPDEAKALVAKRLDAMAAALHELQRFADQLRAVETQGSTQLARWYRLYWENRRATLLAEPGVDPLFPVLHDALITADETLQRRFHGVLAALTGQADEAERMAANWELLEKRLAQAAAKLAKHRVAAGSGSE
jgi:hypothetical protein